MKFWKNIRRGAARAPSLAGLGVRRLLRRFSLSRRDWILYSPLIACMVICAVAAAFLVHYVVLCELPVVLTDAEYQRRDETKEFWPNSLRSEVASAIIYNLTTGRPVSVQPKIPKGKEISFLENSLSPCESSEKYDIIILIKTSLKGKIQRERLRSSWANQHFLGRVGARVKYGFLIGSPNLTLEPQERTVVEEEIARYGDFIIGDFKDGYRSLIFKAMMSLRWTQEFCPNYEFLLIIDDDFDLYLEPLVTFLRDPTDYPNSNYRSNNEVYSKLCRDGCKHFYGGYILPHYFTPDRDSTKKIFLTREEYPPDVFPLYVTGLMIMLSKKTATNMNQLANFMPQVSIEDVYLGLLARKLNIRPFGINHLMTTGFNSIRYVFDFWKSSEIAIGKTEHSFGCD